jgi:hypothetical protein
MMEASVALPARCGSPPTSHEMPFPKTKRVSLLNGRGRRVGEQLLALAKRPRRPV